MLTRRDKLNEDKHEIVEEEGYKFAASKSLAELFDSFVVDYKSGGFNKGFKVRIN